MDQKYLIQFKQSMKQDSEIEQILQTQANTKIAPLNEQEEYIKNRLNVMYRCPPNDEDALLHKAASSFGYNPTIEKGQKIAVCPCCELPINTITLPLSISTTPTTGFNGKSQFFVLDSGASMFFTFIKMVIYYLALLFMLSNLYPTHVSYFTNDYCLNFPEQCGTSWFISFSPVKFSRTNYSYNYQIMNILNVIMIGASIVFFILFRKYQYDIYGMLDLHNSTQDDFTILVKNIPLELPKNDNGESSNHESVLKDMFQEKINNFLFKVNQQYTSEWSSVHKSFKRLIRRSQINPEGMAKVRSVSLCFDLSQMEEVIEERQQLIQEHLKNGKQTSNDGSQKVGQISIPDKIAQINNKYLNLCKNFLSNRSQDPSKTRFVGKAFVSFEFEHYRDYILHLKDSEPQEFMINGEKLKISQANYPSDIYWLNLKIGKWTRVKKIIISYVIVLVVLAVVFAIITGIEVGQQTLDQTQKHQDDDIIAKSIGYGYTILIALIVYVVNYFFGTIIKLLTDWQRHETKTKYLISLIIKMFISQFLNTAMMYFLLSFRQGQHYLLDDGLVVQISNLLIISGCISVPMNFFQIDSKLQQLWRKFRYGFLSHDSLFQIQYNEIHQLPQFDFADRYCYYLVQLFTLVFYSYINPICVPVVMIIAALHYWIDKYNLLKCSSNTFSMNFVISRAILKIFELSIVAFAGGNYYFATKMQGEFNLINFVGLMVAAGYSILAVFSPAYIEDKIFGSQHEIESISYTECLESGAFKQTYWGCNPATMFTVEPDINGQKQYMNIRFSHKIGQIPDLEKFQSEAEKIVFD